MAERGKDERTEQSTKLESLIEKHEVSNRLGIFKKTRQIILLPLWQTFFYFGGF